MGATETVARYIAEVQYEDLPSDVVNKAKLILLDTIGCGIAGARTPIGETTIRAIRDLGGKPEATVFSQRVKTNCLLATYVNAILSDALDYEETLLCHPSATVVPATIAAGEKVHATGEEILTAMVAGYEVAVRIGLAIKPSPRIHKEVAVMFSFLAFGAAAAAGKLLKLGEKQLINAIGYAGVATPLPVWISKWERPLHWVKQNFGEQARAGMMGVLLADKGFIAPHSILDYKLGFPRMIGTDRCDFKPHLRTLGEKFLLLDDTFKPYPACRWIHPVLDAITEMISEESITLEDIECIRIRTFEEMANWFVDYRPATMVDGEFSVPYTVALVLAGIPPGPQWYANTTLTDPRVLELAAKVKLEVDSEAEAQFYKHRKFMSKVEIVCGGNRRLSRIAEYAKGDKEKPMSAQEVISKFTSLATPVLGEQKMNDIKVYIKNLEQSPNISILANCLG